MFTIHDHSPEHEPTVNRARIDVRDHSGEVVTLLCCFLLRGHVVFKPGRGDFEHPAPPFSRLFLLRTGHAVVDANGRRFSLGPGPFHLLPNEMAFRVHYRAGTEIFFFHLHAIDRTGRSIFAGREEVLTVEAPQEAKMIRVGFDQHDLAREFSLVMLVLRECVRPRWSELVERARRASLFPEIFRLLAERPIAAMRISELAALQGVTANALSKRFHRVMGITLKKFLLSEQIRRAQELLTRTDLSVEQLASRLGHEHASYFHRLFRRRCGMSPGQYRCRAHAPYDGDR